MTTTGDKTMQHHVTAMSGPEFLEAVADQNAGNGLDINAQAFRDRAREWANDQRSLQATRQELQDARDRLASIRKATAMATL